MVRLIVYMLGLAAATAGLAWLADQRGEMTIDWPGYQTHLSVFRAVVLLLIFMAVCWFVLSLLRNLIASPGSVSRFVNRRKQQQGLDALTNGMIAVGAGDRQLATRYASLASRALPNEPLTQLLRAQTAQLAGDRKTAQRVYEQMLISPQTELHGLRGLFLDAQNNNDLIAARGLAEQALKRSPALAWATQALFDIQCRQGDWPAAIETLTAARRNDLVSRKDADRRRAVLLTAQAQALEETESAKAEALALEAHELAPELVPAAEIAGRLLAARGRMQKAATVIEQTWKRAPHPDLALVYAHARPGDSPRDRLQRVRKLAALTPGNREAVMAVASAAIDARAWDEARTALDPLLADRLSARVCVLKARAEGGEKGDQGRLREWLARAIHAPRDPVWVADGHVSDRWAAVSPVTGKLDAYEWRVAENHSEKVSGALLLEELAQFEAARQDGSPDAAGADERPQSGRGSTGRPDRSKAELVGYDEGAGPARAAPAPASAAASNDTEPTAQAGRRVLQPVEAAKPDATEVAVETGSADAARTGGTKSAGMGEPAVPASAPVRRPPSAPTQVAANEASVEFYVPPRAPDDPGTEPAEVAGKAAS